MGRGCGEPKKKKEKALYECTVCGKTEMKEAKGEDVKSCCGQPMKKK